MEEKKIIPFIATFDDNFVELSEVCFKSLLKHHNNAKIYVIGNRLSDESKSILKSIDETITFLASPKTELEIWDISNKGEKRWTDEVFNKFEVMNMPEFSEYDKVVEIDVDTIFLGNVQKYFDGYANGNMYVAPIKVTPMEKLGRTMDTYKKLLAFNVYLCNSGFQILNLKAIREDNIYKRCIHGFRTTDINEFKQFEEDVIYNGCYPNIQQLPKPQFTLNGDGEVTEDTIFVHYVGANKPDKADCNYRELWLKEKEREF